MSRICIESSLKDDPRFISVCVKLKSRQKAIGFWYDIASVAQSYWKEDKSPIPFHVYEWHKFPKIFIDSGLVEKRETGYYLKGSERNFAWIYSKVLGGRASKGGGRPIEITGNKNNSDNSTKTAQKQPLLLLPLILKESYIYCSVVNYLNEKIGSKYKSSSPKTKQLIDARVNDGFTLENFKTVIDKKASQWINDSSMCKYLRPETLFSNKFESYLNEINSKTEDQEISETLNKMQNKYPQIFSESEEKNV